MPTKLYFAALRPGSPASGLGAFALGSGRCCYYSDGRETFFVMGSSAAAFTIDAGYLAWMVEQLAERNALYVDDHRLRWLAS
jgi:hypothetical protein